MFTKGESPDDVPERREAKCSVCKTKADFEDLIRCDVCQELACSDCNIHFKSVMPEGNICNNCNKL